MHCHTRFDLGQVAGPQ